MNNELELIKIQADKLRWMIKQLDNSCDGTPEMVQYILTRRTMLEDTMAHIAILNKERNQ